ncbi:MAG: hypothetical protein L3J47_03100 [Sulfurovum sp.]|nr:hypothetical protein [Sulfurovum sp.]
MKHLFPYLAILFVILYALYNAFIRTPTSSAQTKPSATYRQHIKTHTVPHAKEELARIDTPEFTRKYIIDIINHGSEDLHYKPQEIMEGGFASKEDAPKIACYLLALRGDVSPKSCPKNAPMYYTSNCAGCHGEDAKGLNGTYPDLTRKPLLGIAKRKEALMRLIKSAIIE